VLVVEVQQLPQMTLMITPLKANHAAQMKTVRKDFFAETKKLLVAGSLFVLCSKLQLTMMAVAWIKMEKLLATGTFPQVTQLRALTLVSTEETQDSGALIQTAIRLECGEMQKALKREHSREIPITQTFSSTLLQRMSTLPLLLVKTVANQIASDTGSNVLMVFTVYNKIQQPPLVAITSV
jgi:hypothetical protein